MLFRVWDKKTKRWTKEPIRIDGNGNVFYQDLSSFSYSAPWYLSNDYEIEFNTGLTLDDETETFYGDIIAIQDDYLIGGAEYLVLTESTVWNMIDDRYYLFKYPHSFRPFVKLVGNIHETELTDAMKVWINCVDVFKQL